MFRSCTAPSRATVTTALQPSFGRRPDRRHTLTPTTPAGGEYHSGLCPLVASFMKRAQSGTATSLA
jgi:hypothetical protein